MRHRFTLFGEKCVFLKFFGRGFPHDAQTTGATKCSAIDRDRT